VSERRDSLDEPEHRLLLGTNLFGEPGSGSSLDLKRCAVTRWVTEPSTGAEGRAGSAPF
jgi:hypothetical protein